MAEASTTATATAINNDDTNTGYNPLSYKQELALFIIGALSVSLSLSGSGIITFLLIRTEKWKTELQHRLVAGLTIMDIILTMAIIFQSFAVPAQTGRRFARGSFVTCEWTGFFYQFYLGGALYNVALSFYYCLMITYGWKEYQIKRWMEPLVHIIAFGTPPIFGAVAMAHDVINPDPILGVCAINDPFPYDCVLADNVDCERGSKDSPLKLMANGSYLAAVATGIYFTIRVYMSVRNQTRRNLQYSVNGELEPAQKLRIREVGNQAVLYTAGFLNGFLGVLIGSIVDQILLSEAKSTKELKDEPSIFPMLLILYFLFPLQGLWNCFVYMRPRFIRWRQFNNDRSNFWAFQMVLTGKRPCRIDKAPQSAHHLQIISIQEAVDDDGADAKVTTDAEIKAMDHVDESIAQTCPPGGEENGDEASFMQEPPIGDTIGSISE